MKHLAVIMDGNRRWAKRRGLKPWAGHREGTESVKRITEFCLKKQIPYLSLYTFSLENFNRSEAECSYLFNIIRQEARKNLELFVNHGVRVRILGQQDLFPDSVRSVFGELEEKTKHLHKLNLNFLFCYGARQEIISGVKTLIQKLRQGLIKEQDISEKALADCLLTAGMPEPDLIIRTGGALRLSNFLLFQAAYSEFCFLECLWPDLQHKHLQHAYDQFKQVQRNFGS